MATTDLGQCEWFVWDLRRSNLIERGRLEQVVGEFLAKKPRAEPAELADFLVHQDIITRFQADRLLAGKTQGFVLGPYTLSDALGTGSMGTVYKAQSKNDQSWYAVKVLPRRSMWNIRLARRKVRDFEGLDHPAIVPFKDVGTAGGMHYLVWPLVEGEPLDKLVERHGKLPPSVAALYAFQTAEGLDTCHQRNTIHGLLKPSNLLVGPDQHVKILDLGIGSLLAETESESIVDTMSTANTLASGLDCAAPESIEDPKKGLTMAADQYSLGCTLYFCLTGQFPFPGSSAVEKMMAHQTKKPAPIQNVAPDAPSDLVAVVDRLMEKTPEKRYASMSDVVAALKPLTAGAGTAALLLKQHKGATPAPEARQVAAAATAPARSTAAPTGAPPSRTSPAAAPAAAPERAPAPLSLPDRRSFGAPAATEGQRPRQTASSDDMDAESERQIGPLGLAMIAILVVAITWLIATNWEAIRDTLGL